MVCQNKSHSAVQNISHHGGSKVQNPDSSENPFLKFVTADPAEYDFLNGLVRPALDLLRYNRELYLNHEKYLKMTQVLEDQEMRKKIIDKISILLRKKSDWNSTMLDFLVLLGNQYDDDHAINLIIEAVMSWYGWKGKLAQKYPYEPMNPIETRADYEALAALTGLKSKKAKQVFYDLLKNVSSPNDKLKIAEWLALRPDLECKRKGLEVYAETFKDSEISYSHEIRWASNFRRVSDKRSDDATLLREMITSPSPALNSLAAEILKNKQFPTLENDMIAAVERGAAGKEKYLQALANIASWRSVPAVTKILRNENGDETITARENALAVLAKVKGWQLNPDTLQAVRDIAANEKSVDLYGSALMRLAEIEDEESFDILIKRMEESQSLSTMYSIMLSMVGQMGGRRKEAFDLLVRHTRRGNLSNHIRQATAGLISMVRKGNEDAFKFLIKEGFSIPDRDARDMLIKELPTISKDDAVVDMLYKRFRSDKTPPYEKDAIREAIGKFETPYSIALLLKILDQPLNKYE